MSTNEVLAISNKPGEVALKWFDYIKDSLLDDLKGKLLEDYYSGRYTVLPEWE